MENILRISIILLSVHFSFIPLWALTSVAFHLLTEWRDSSERWGRECGECSSLWIEFILPERTSNRPASISQVEHRWLSHARRPSAQRIQMHRGCPLTRQTYWHTDQERANWTAVTQTQQRLQHTHTFPPKTSGPPGPWHHLRSAKHGLMSNLNPISCMLFPVLLQHRYWTSVQWHKVFTFLLPVISAHGNYGTVNVQERSWQIKNTSKKHFLVQKRSYFLHFSHN